MITCHLCRFNAHNVLGIRQFADSLSCPHLVAAADKYIHHYFCKVALSDEFQALSTAELLDIVRSDELNVGSEETIFEAAMRWIKHDEISRAALLPKVYWLEVTTQICYA